MFKDNKLCKQEQKKNVVDIYPRRRVTIYSEATRKEANRNWKEKRKQKEKRGSIYI